MMSLAGASLAVGPALAGSPKALFAAPDAAAPMPGAAAAAVGAATPAVAELAELPEHPASTIPPRPTPGRQGGGAGPCAPGPRGRRFAQCVPYAV
jgi:hypothetical protein